MAVHLGFYNTSGTRTHVRFQFSTHVSAGANVAPSSAFESADLRLYRANDSAAFSATQRASANGIVMTSPFDTLVGFHDVDIDLTDNSDAGWYAAGYLIAIVLAPDETVDSQTLTGVVLAYFEIGVQPVNVTQFGGTAATTSGGRPEVIHSATELNAIADALLDRDMDVGTDSGSDSTATRTVRQALRRLRNREAISAGVGTVYKEDDTTASWTYAATTAAGNPLSEVNPT